MQREGMKRKSANNHVLYAWNKHESHKCFTCTFIQHTFTEFLCILVIVLIMGIEL